MEGGKAFTGRTRRRKTSRAVQIGDHLARGLITVGGIGTIGAVMLVCIFLVYEVWPLFAPTHMGEGREFAPTWKALPPVQVGIDEYRVLGWGMLPNGHFQVLRLSDGKSIQELKPLEDEELSRDGQILTAWAFSEGPSDNTRTESKISGGNQVAFGFADGTVRLGMVGFSTTFLDVHDAPAELRSVEPGESVPYEDGLASRISESQFRIRKLEVELKPPVQSADQSAVALIDHVQRTTGPIYGALSADGTIKINAVRERHNIMTDEVILTAKGTELPLPVEIREKARYLLISGLGDSVFVAWKDGRMLRYDIRDLEHPRKVEELDLVPEPGETLNSLVFLLGRGTLISGDSLGRVRAWFGTRPADAQTDDGTVLVRGHELADHETPVTAICSSSRSRMVAVGYEDGRVQLVQVTSEKTMAEVQAPEKVPVHALALAPKNDGLLALTSKGVGFWEFKAGHPEVTLSTLFRPVWYEGFPQPDHAWQSSGAQDSVEAKLGLWPLVFGTIKATIYSMLFGAPLALLAALYTSEFLQPRVKARIKPTIEMMASLPSVVLGFLAGLVIAPLVEGIVPEVITTFFCVPLVFLTCAYLWLMLPPTTSIRLARWRFPIILFVALPIGIATGWFLGPVVERLLFAGNIKEWLDGQIGTGVGGWMLLLIPLSGICTAYLMSRTVNPWLRDISQGWSRTRSASANLIKFLGGVAFTILLAWVVSMLLTAVHLDPRGTYVDTYVQRNAMIVGFVMGFAIIPIIYTIADDALSTVPEHLRSASLGAGATPWQTAMRIVIPTAMSGLFSALMIGLGRAVGETMIVLMAAGNTPVRQMNIFNGFQTLSAAIATELPEATAGDTHYRVLFLAALTLFVITFVVNTMAEIVRQRFRRRAYEL